MVPPPGLRWRLADDDDGQDALFEEEIERHIGRGEYRGLEFLHVRAGRIINEVPKASRVPFRFTINAYRGCSHACSYCLEGTTPVLMGDGRTVPIAELEVGDEIYGTTRVGSYRRFVRTRVLAHWSTRKPGYRVTLEDGTQVVASGDHRFLTDRGWAFVTAGGPGARRPAHLIHGSQLMGPDGLESPGVGEGNHGRVNRDTLSTALRLEMTGRVVRAIAGLRVVAVEPLPGDLPMFDITTGTGDFIANGLVSHNCFARPTHEYLGMNSGDDFERRIVVKINAVERLRAELSPARWPGDHIAMGTNTDPYQRCEGKYRLTQGIVRVLSEARNPFSILTKSTLILRDLDLLAEAAKVADVRANLSIGTLDEEVWRMTEPGTPHPLRRVEAVARLNQAGVPCGVLVAPVLPGLSDRDDQLEAVVKACVEAGACSISTILLHLRAGVREHYLEWLRGRRPDLVERYESLYPRAYAPGAVQDELARRVAELVSRFGGLARRPGRMRTVAAQPVPRRGRAGQVGQQMSLPI